MAKIKFIPYTVSNILLLQLTYVYLLEVERNLLRHTQTYLSPLTLNQGFYREKPIIIRSTKNSYLPISFKVCRYQP